MTDIEQSKQDDQDFLDLIKQIAMRPAMYVGITDIYRVVTLIFGYGWGFAHGRGRRSMFVAGGSPVDGFGCFVRLKFVNNHPAWGIERILLHEHGHDHKAAIGALPGLFEEFISQKYDEEISVFVEAFSDKLDKAIIEKYGPESKTGSWAQGAPDCDQCQPLA